MLPFLGGFVGAESGQLELTVPTIATDIGARQRQEDRAVIASVGYGCTVAVLADGMGGHRDGDKAAESACEAALRTLQRAHSLSRATRTKAIPIVLRAVDAAASAVHSLGGGYKPPGCTLIIAVVWRDELLVAHVGDSIVWVDGKRLTTQHGVGRFLDSSVPGLEHVEIHAQALHRSGPVRVVIASDGIEEDSGGTAQDVVAHQLAKGIERQDNATAIVLDGATLPHNAVVWAHTQGPSPCTEEGA